MTNGSSIYGIDLGTTYSSIAFVSDAGRAEVAPNSNGKFTTPSVVLFEGSTSLVVGEEAKKCAKLYPDRVVEMVKRHMGDANWSFYFEGVNYRADEIASYILRKVVEDAEAYTNTTIRDVVITCPAYFGINEREATVRAGQIAGLNVLEILNEPIAAALSFGTQNEQNQVVLVYDLGGGTFDITMIEIKDNSFTILATGGDEELGGRDWDAVVVTYLAQEWMRETGSSDDPTTSPESLQDLWISAEDAKRTLSVSAEARVRVSHVGQPVSVTLTREKFDELTAGLLEQTIFITRHMLDAARQNGYVRFDKVLLVGGSSYMPQVSARLKREFGVDPQSNEPDLSVARGAALYGQKLLTAQNIQAALASKTGQKLDGSDLTAGTPAEIRRAEQQTADDYGPTGDNVASQVDDASLYRADAVEIMRGWRDTPSIGRLPGRPPVDATHAGEAAPPPAAPPPAAPPTTPSGSELDWSQIRVRGNPPAPSPATQPATPPPPPAYAPAPTSAPPQSSEGEGETLRGFPTQAAPPPPLGPDVPDGAPAPGYGAPAGHPGSSGYPGYPGYPPAGYPGYPPAPSGYPGYTPAPSYPQAPPQAPNAPAPSYPPYPPAPGYAPPPGYAAPPNPMAPAPQGGYGYPGPFAPWPQTPAAPVATAEQVTFTAYHLKEIAPLVWEPLYVYIALDTPQAKEQVQAAAQQVLAGRMGEFRPAMAAETSWMRRGALLTFVPTLPGCVFNPPELTVPWQADVQQLAFGMQAATARPGFAVNGSIQVFTGPLLRADIPISLFVRQPGGYAQAPQPPRDFASVAARAYRKVFASYSHRDTPIVQSCETAAQVTGDRYLRDVTLLRSGEQWNDRLLQAIGEADLFQLFWSENSARSPAVQTEWRHALTLQPSRGSFIRPVFWSRQVYPIPPELQAIHFERMSLARLGWGKTRIFLHDMLGLG